MGETDGVDFSTPVMSIPLKNWSYALITQTQTGNMVYKSTIRNIFFIFYNLLQILLVAEREGRDFTIKMQFFSWI